MTEDKAKDTKGAKGKEEGQKDTEAPKKQRRQRVPLGARNVLKFSQRPGYVRRVVNDVDDRVQRFKEAGWEVVYGEETGGEPKAGAASKVGSAIAKPVGGGRTGVLMEIPEEYYREDQVAKQKEIDDVEASMRKRLRPDQADDRLGQYGNVTIS